MAEALKAILIGAGRAGAADKRWIPIAATGYQVIRGDPSAFDVVDFNPAEPGVLRIGNHDLRKREFGVTVGQVGRWLEDQPVDPLVDQERKLLFFDRRVPVRAAKDRVIPWRYK